MPAKTHTMHGRDHCPGGSDPIPCLNSSGTPGSFVDYLTSIGDLRAYWRLGETDEPFADTAGHVSGPFDMVYGSGTGSAPTPDVTGGLSPGEDDGAVQFNNVGPLTSQGQPLQSGSPFAGIASAFTACAWVKPAASTAAFRGGVFSNLSVVAGSPDFEKGWALEVAWPGGTGDLVARFTRSISAASAEATTSLGPVADAWCFLACTYDGATRRLYVNGALAADDADVRVLTPDSLGTSQIGEIPYMPGGPPVNKWGPFLGVIDEVALWERVLTGGEILTLYNLGVTGSTAAPSGAVLTADGAGGSSYQPLPPVVDTFAAEGETPLTGDITFSEGANVTLTQVGNDIEIAATGSSPAADTLVWMPLTTVTGGVPELVWDGDDELIPTLVTP